MARTPAIATGTPAPAAAPTPSTGQTAAAHPDKVVASDDGGEIVKPGAERDDAGTVVGAMQSSNAVHAEQAVAVGGVKAVPAVRATARKLGVDLSRVRATGTDGAVTMADVKQAAADGSAKIGAAPAPVAAAAVAAPAPAARQTEARAPLSAAGKPMRTQPPGVWPRASRNSSRAFAATWRG
jgi:2-oxoisovalerate dehydrogenase E2 component (dihydrolipoyl transacylase)